MTNKYNLNDVVVIQGYTEEYKIVGMEFDTYNKPKKIWYNLYRLSDGHTSIIAENVLKAVNSNCNNESDKDFMIRSGMGTKGIYGY